MTGYAKPWTSYADQLRILLLDALERIEIALRVDLSYSGSVMVSWLRSLNYVRNVCAHHSRLWNRNVVDQPKLPKKGAVQALDVFHGKAWLVARPFALLCICQHLMQQINPHSSWSQRVRVLLESFPPLHHVGLTLQGMGMEAQ